MVKKNWTIIILPQLIKKKCYYFDGFLYHGA